MNRYLFIEAPNGLRINLDTTFTVSILMIDFEALKVMNSGLKTKKRCFTEVTSLLD